MEKVMSKEELRSQETYNKYNSMNDIEKEIFHESININPVSFANKKNLCKCFEYEIMNFVTGLEESFFINENTTEDIDNFMLLCGYSEDDSIDALTEVLNEECK